MRVLGFIEVALLAVQLAVSTFKLPNCSLLRADIMSQTVERRLPPKVHSGPFLDFSVFKNASFSIYTLSSFLAFLGIYTVSSRGTVQ